MSATTISDEVPKGLRKKVDGFALCPRMGCGLQKASFDPPGGKVPLGTKPPLPPGARSGYVATRHALLTTMYVRTAAAAGQRVASDVATEHGFHTTRTKMVAKQ